MIGFWSFYPHKTRKHKTICKVCNTPECSDLLILLLRERVKFYHDKMKRGNSLMKIEKTDTLFGNRKGSFKTHIQPHSVSLHLSKKNSKVQEERERELKKLLEKGELKQREYYDLLENAPRFHAHALRKYFISTLARNCSDLRLCAAMEGHVPHLKHDSSYNKVTDEEIKDAYLNAIPDLSFERTEVRLLTNNEREKLEDKVRVLEEQNKEMKDNMEIIAENVAEKMLEDKFDKILKDFGY